MVKALPYKDLNVPAHVEESIARRLGYFIREVRLSVDEYNAGLTELSTRPAKSIEGLRQQNDRRRELLPAFNIWQAKHLALIQALGDAQREATQASSVKGPPDWACNKDTDFKGGKVQWPQGLEDADPGIRLQWLIRLKHLLPSNDLQTDSLGDVLDNIDIAKKELVS